MFDLRWDGRGSAPLRDTPESLFSFTAVPISEVSLSVTQIMPFYVTPVCAAPFLVKPESAEPFRAVFIMNCISCQIPMELWKVFLAANKRYSSDLAISGQKRSSAPRTEKNVTSCSSCSCSLNVLAWEEVREARWSLCARGAHSRGRQLCGVTCCSIPGPCGDRRAARLQLL